MLNFTKMNGAGNDFVLMDNRSQDIVLSREQIALICDRHRGIGADGLLLVEPATEGADFRMRYYNSDGGEAEMCGNGARCFARFASKIAGMGNDVRFETIAGPIRAHIEGRNVTLNMSAPHDLMMQRDLEIEGKTLSVHSVNTGVPHAVIETEDIDQIDLCSIGSAIRHHGAFAPAGTNVNFIQQSGPSSAAIRTYERGVENETLACGTGVVAAAIILHKLHGGDPPVTLRVRGGEDLKVGFREENGVYSEVTLCGPADFIFDGTIDPPGTAKVPEFP